jgi:hypothetical protein
MHPIIDVSVLTIENKDNMKKNPCSSLFSVLLSFHKVNISKSSHVKVNQQTKKRVLSGQNEDEGNCSTKERKGYIPKGVTSKGSKSQDSRSLIQGGDPNEERGISPSMEKLKRHVFTQPT